MAEGKDGNSLKENNCSNCYITSNLEFQEEIVENIIMNYKPHNITEYLDTHVDNSVIMEIEYSSATDKKRSKKARKQEDKLNNDKRQEFVKQEIQNAKHLASEQLQKINKLVTDFGNTLTSYNEKFVEVKNTLEEKLEYITKLEKENSCLKHGYEQLSQRLDFVEHSLIHAKTELNYIQLGQQLNVDFSTPPRLYNTDFQVRDHKMSGGVWLYNNRDTNCNVDSGLAASTEYFSTESPGKSTTITGFQMAPGGERRKSTTEPAPKDTVDELQRRLDNLRGFNL